MTRRHYAYIATAMMLTFIGAVTRSSAGLHHRSVGLVCSDCHVMHYNQSGAGPYAKLLKANSTELCLSCHDGAMGSGDVAPDVLQEAGPGQPDLRSAGAFQGLPGEPTERGHDLLVEAVPAGGATSLTLNCLSCHDAHGNANYRNLVSAPGGVSGLAVTAVVETETSPTATQYSVGNVAYRDREHGLSAWCGGCHGDFHGGSGAGNMGGSTTGDTNQEAVSPWLRHPARGVTLAQGRFNQHIDPNRWFDPLSSRVPVISASAVVPGGTTGSDNEVFCGTCHKAHGSPHKYALIWDNPETVASEDGAALMETCQQCHYK